MKGRKVPIRDRPEWHLLRFQTAVIARTMYRDVPVRRPGVPREAGCRERPASDAAISKCLILSKRDCFASLAMTIVLSYVSAIRHRPLIFCSCASRIFHGPPGCHNLV